MAIKRGIEIGIRRDVRTRAGAFYVEPVVRVDDFYEPFGTFDRPATGQALATAIGIPTAVPVAYWKCDEAPLPTYILVDTFGRTALTASAVSARAGEVGLGLNSGDGTLTGLKVAECSPYSTNNFTAADNALLDFPSGSVAMLGVVRFTQIGNGNLRGIMGKMNDGATVGYGVEDAGGAMFMRASDGATSTNLTSTYTLIDGAWHYFACIWDRTANLARLITDKGGPETATIAAITGSMSAAAIPFRLGINRSNILTPGAQFALAAVFTGSAAEALNNKTALDAWWTARVGKHPDGWTYTRASTLGCQVGSGSAGAQVHVWGTSRFAHGWGSNLDGNKLGMMASPAVTNLLPYSDCAITFGWGHSGSVTTGYGADPRLMTNSVRTQKTGSADRLTTAVALVSGTQYCFSIYTKSTSSIPFLRVMNDNGGTVMAANTARTDGRAVVADSGWHQVYMTYTPSSGSLYRFEALASTHSSSVGDAEFQYAQVNAGPYPMPLSFTIGAAAATARTVLKRPLTLEERRGLGARGAFVTRAQSHTIDPGSAAAYQVSLGEQTSLSRCRFLGIGTGEHLQCGIYNNSGVFLNWAIALPELSPTALRTGSFWCGSWDERGIRGSTSRMSARLDGTKTAAAHEFTGSLDPSYLYVGSTSEEERQWVGPIQRVVLYRDPPEDV